MKKISISAIAGALVLCGLSSCNKNEYLPPDWAYDIPDTPLACPSQLGAFYNIYTTSDWASYSGYTPVLNLVIDEGEIVGDVPYTATQDGILIRQCEYAKKAGIDFFVIPWNASTEQNDFLSAWEFYLDNLSGMQLVFNYSFSHLKLSGKLTGEGPDFNKVVDDFASLNEKVFSKDYYYHMPDGRPIIVVSGMNSANVDWESFLPAFRSEMELIEEGNALNFYIIGENTTNWANPVTNGDSEKWLDANYVRNWYPTTYYERWAFFYSFTDQAWQNWSKYARNWENDYVPCLYPEYKKDDTKARFLDRTEENFTKFCNVAKRNMGSKGVILINSWNDFSIDSALEPTVEYGELYLELTKKNLK